MAVRPSMVSGIGAIAGTEGSPPYVCPYDCLMSQRHFVTVFTPGSVNQHHPINGFAHAESKQTSGAGIEFFVLRPEAAPPAAGYPLVLFLHGYAMGPFDVALAPPAAARHGLHALAGCAVVAPVIPPGRFFMPAELCAVVDSVVAGGEIDERRLYLTGYSMGAHAVVNLVIQYPHKFAAAMAVSPPTGLPGMPAWALERWARVTQPALWSCGCASPRPFPTWLFACLRTLKCYYTFVAAAHKRGCVEYLEHPQAFWREDVARAKSVPLWLLHGEADSSVPFEASLRLYEALRAEGSTRVHLTVYPGAGHAVCGRTFGDGQVYGWLLSHRARASNANGSTPGVLAALCAKPRKLPKDARDYRG